MRAPASVPVQVLLSALALSVALGAAGCIEYTDRVSCSNGMVLGEDDECVAPPVPDGGVEVATCAELCTALTGFDATQLACIDDNLVAFGAPPAECMTDLSVEADCTACVAALALGDSTCATAGALCQ